MVTKTISVPEIHCDHCKTSIEGAVGAIDGVEGATVDISARTVTVIYDDASVDHGSSSRDTRFPPGRPPTGRNER